MQRGRCRRSLESGVRADGTASAPGAQRQCSCEGQGQQWIERSAAATPGQAARVGRGHRRRGRRGCRRRTAHLHRRVGRVAAARVVGDREAHDHGRAGRGRDERRLAARRAPTARSAPLTSVHAYPLIVRPSAPRLPLPSAPRSRRRPAADGADTIAIGRSAASTAPGAWTRPAPQVEVVQLHSDSCGSSSASGIRQVGTFGIGGEAGKGIAVACSAPRAVRAPRLPLTENMSAATPDTIGAAKLVPTLKLLDPVGVAVSRGRGRAEVGGRVERVEARLAHADVDAVAARRRDGHVRAEVREADLGADVPHAGHADDAPAVGGLVHREPSLPAETTTSTPRAVISSMADW